MSEPTTGTANNQTEPTATVNPPEPSAPAVGDGKPQEPASSEGTLLNKPADELNPNDPKPGEPAKPAEPAKAEGAPEKYEFANANQYDAKVLEAFSESAKEANLTQDAAQKLLDKVAPALAARTDEQVKAVHQQWIEETKADKELGGEKLNENLGIAKKALDQFGTPELKTFLETTGLGNNRDVIRFMYRVGKAISEDGFVSGNPSGKSTVNPASVLYDNTTRKE